MRTIAVVAVAALAGCTPDLEVASLDIVAGSAPVITSVTTDDGFTQVRQSSTVSLVIRGMRFEQTTAVTVTGLFLMSLDSVTPHEVRVTMFAPSSPPGPADATVTTKHGSATAPGALELTPFVVSPTAVTGHGTFQSPMNLCDSELQFADSRSIVRLLAGTHHCDHAIIIMGGTVSGDPDHPTVVTGTDAGGFGILAGLRRSTMAIRDLTFAPPLAEWSISFEGELDVERVIDAGGIQGDGESFLKLDRYTYEGEGTALSLSGAEITQSSIRHCGPATAINVFRSPESRGFLMDGVLVEDCERGVVASGVPGFDVNVEIANAKFIDTRIAIAANRATTLIRDTAIADDESTPSPVDFGIAVGSGRTTVRNVQITGQSEAGISISHTTSDGHDAQVDIDGLVVIGGRVGIDFIGIDNALRVRNATIRDQTRAAILIHSNDGPINLGRPDSPGNNTLSVISGIVLDDQRFFGEPFFRYINATGTTLNGVSFDGQTIDGPAELLPYYRIGSSDSGIRF